MCGIAGVINFQNIDLKRIMTLLQHRGPDDQSLYTNNNVALIHTRLAIQDIQFGSQPFHFQNYSIIFNGEIYNHKELRKSLQEFSFNTNSDTETLLYLFIKYNDRMFDMIDGMYAFCIYDKENEVLILGRDRAGKKPLYYYKDDQVFIFASELNAIKRVKSLTIAPESIECYLRAGFIWRPHTAYKNVLELEAGTYLILDPNSLNFTTHKYFDLLNVFQKPPSSSTKINDAIIELEDKLMQSVKTRIMASDVDVGVFLSGGIDSNLIAAFASKIKHKIKTFTVKFEGLYDESYLAKLTAEKYKTDHFELNITSNLKDDVEKIILSYGEPFMDSSAIPSYYVSREASKHVKVILSGDGADELFAGYRRYVPSKYAFSQYAKIMSPLLKFLPKPNRKQSAFNYLYRLIAMQNKKGLDFYLSATTDIFEDVLPIANNAVTNQLSQFIDEIFSNPSLTSLNKMLYADFSIILFCNLLVKMDIASMANSLEVRSPFLSKQLLEFAPALLDKHKISNFKTKYILRKLAEKYLPTELVNQPKRGFEVPLKKWVENDLRDVIHDTLKPGCYSENYVGKAFINNILTNKLSISSEKRAKILWSMYCLEVWYFNETKDSIRC